MLGLTGVTIALLVVMAVRLDRSFARYRIKKNYTAAVNAPSVSVCIPARNETHAMTQCLERVLASDYEKMEIVVFDDSSSDDTSILIRSFAHAGVRFVPGTELPEGWLGKNHALEILAREASGTYVVFMDVDTFIQPTTISQLVSYMITEDAQMVSVIPRRNDAWRASVLFGHLRYFWELVLARAKSPAVASTLWAVQRSTLLDTYGGFVSLKASVAPESTLAQLLGSTYRCLIADKQFNVAYEKRWHSQIETGRRLLYPRVGGHWWNGALALVGLLLLNWPFFAVLGGLVFGWTLWHTAALGALFVGMIVYVAYTRHLWDKGWWFGGLLWPVVVLQELLLFIGSMVGYARRTITWKGRPVASKVQTDRIEI
jgi:glycosyltransferase involved in cell wall biosynthesis